MSEATPNQNPADSFPPNGGENPTSDTRSKADRAHFTVDALERAFFTSLEAFGGVGGATLLFNNAHFDPKYATAAGIGAAILSILKALSARFLGDKSSAAFLPRRLLKRS